MASPLVIPTKRTEDEEATIPPSLLPSIEPPRKEPRIRGILPDQINEWREIDQIKTFDNLTAEKCPSEFTFRNMGDSVVYFRLVFNEGIPIVKESIRISNTLQVSLRFEDIPVPLPEMIRCNPYARIQHFKS